MPSDTLTVLRDIEQHIDRANRFVAGLNFDQFENDERTIFAVIRCLEIISEASRRLPEEVRSQHPAIPWKNIAGAGNVYRHDYEEITPKIVWDTVQLALPALRSAIAEEIARMGSSEDDG
jgi:uncharacterized protein with HEPN domain